MQQAVDWEKNPLSYELEILTLVNNEGVGFDIRALMLECHIYESITNNFLVGEIAIADAVGLLENAKIFGQESLRIKFRQPTGGGTPTPPENKIDQIFRIYKVGGIHRIGQNTTVYKLYFCAPELIHAKRIRVSQAVRGSMTDLAAAMARDHLGILPRKPSGARNPYVKRHAPYFEIIEKSVEENLHIIIPNWTVNFAINWLLQNAQGVDSKSGLQDSFFFFQTANGSFRIQSIAEMISTDYLSGEKFYYAPAAGKEPAADRDMPGVPPLGKLPRIGPGRKILDYTVGSSANVLEGIIEGLFAQKQITIDNTYKYQTETNYDYLESFYSGKSIENQRRGDRVRGTRVISGGVLAPTGVTMTKEFYEGFPLVRQDKEKIWIGNAAGPDTEELEVSEYHMSKWVKDDGTINSYSDAHTTLTSDSRFVNDDKDIYHQANHKTHLGSTQLRTAMRQLLNYYTVNLLLPTRTDITVGQVINLDIPPTEGWGVEDRPALFHSGRYLITEIKWALTPEGCRTNVKVIKDSLVTQIETAKVEYAPTITKETKK